jgi:hypothetical protein
MISIKRNNSNGNHIRTSDPPEVVRPYN